jgi:hypothetical protein|nr:MAG TPA: hypothetical protein [Caudoviricetes sp.]
MIDTFKQIELSKAKFINIKNKSGKVVDVKAVTEKKKYLLVFNINVIDALDNKYAQDNKNGFEVFLEKLDSKDTADIWRTSVDFLVMCINEGIRQKNVHRKSVGLKEDEYIKNEEINITALDATNLAIQVINNGVPEQKN